MADYNLAVKESTPDQTVNLLSGMTANASIETYQIGGYPALRAARLRPIEALRYE